MKPQNHSMVDLLTTSPTLSQIVNKVDQLAKLNRIVHQKCDPELAKHCRVANYRDGILSLITHSPAAGHLLRFAKSDLLTALRRMPEWCHLKSIKIHVQPNPQEESKISSISNTPSDATIPKGIATELKEAALNIDYKPLQQALLRLSKQHP